MENITKHCKACEIKYNKDKKIKKSEFKFPTNIPVSESMRKSINIFRGAK